MKTEPSYNHPIDLYPQKIKDEGIVVFDDVRGLPTLEEPFVSPDYAICIVPHPCVKLFVERQASRQRSSAKETKHL